jgi:hypothetical protein
MGWKVYSANGDEKYEVKRLRYRGVFMRDRSIEFTASSPTPILFEIGDYMTYRNERFELNYIPGKEKTASIGSNGEAFKYDKVTFRSVADELTRCSFLDYVLSDNKLHYSGLSKFSFYASSVRSLAERIQVNLDRVYQGAGKWTIVVNPTIGKSEMNIDVSDMNCFDALGFVHEKWELYFVITGRTVAIGYDPESLPTEFTYKDTGLYSIKQDTKSDVQVITRLRAFGSTKNMPYRYYNNKGNVPDGMYCPNLMLPGFTSSGGDIYIESPNKDVYGIREATVYFDGTDGRDDIHPTIENMTANDIRSLGLIVFLPPGDNGNLDELLDVQNLPTDNGIAPPEGVEDTRSVEFDLVLKDVGFHLPSYLSTAGEASISMKSGKCIGREFTIVGYREDRSPGYLRNILTCNRSDDSDLNRSFPNSSYTISPGDKFVLLNINMPDAYIGVASNKLLEKSQEYLGAHDKFQFTFNPKIWRGYFPNRQPLADSFVEGKLMPVKDVDLDIEGSIPIQSLTIREGEDLLPYYEVELSDSVVFSKIQRTLNNIEEVHREVREGNEGLVRYTKRRIHDIVETQKELEKEMLSGFTSSISPLTIQAMQGFFGSIQLQFVFVNSKIDPQHVVSNTPQYDHATGVLTCQEAFLKHQTLGIDTLTSSHKPAEYRYWDVSALTTDSLPTDSLLRLYVKCSKTEDTGEYLLSEEPIAVEQEAGYYHFLMGYLTSTFDGERSWSRLYGFTEILPGQVTTDIIQDPNGNLVLDLVNGTIKGYGRMSDRPDLSIYATYSQLTILGDEISARVTDISDTIATAGWITTAQGNSLFASKTLEDGNVVASLINQTATTVKIQAEKIDLQGRVTFSMFDSATQGRTDATALRNSLGSLAYQGSVRQAMEDETLIVGGYIKTALIDTNTIFANAARIGKFTIQDGWLTCNENDGGGGYINLRGTNTQVALGHNFIPVESGPNYTCPAIITNYNLAGHTGHTEALRLEAGGSNDSLLMVEPVALYAQGGIRTKGCTSFIRKTYALNGFMEASDASPLEFYDTFVFQPTSVLGAYLPTASEIAAKFGYFNDGYSVSLRGFIKITILCTRFSTSMLRVYPGDTSTPIIDNNGNTMSYVQMEKGDVVTLAYYNQAWYRIGWLN